MVKLHTTYDESKRISRGSPDGHSILTVGNAVMAGLMRLGKPGMRSDGRARARAGGSSWTGGLRKHSRAGSDGRHE